MSLAVRIALLRPLARRDPLRYGPRLAEALVTRSQQVKTRTSFVAHRTAAAEEAVALHRRLDAEQPGRHRAGLARALVAQAAVPDDRSVAAALAQCEEAIGYVEDATDRPSRVALAEARWLAATFRYRSGEVREALRLALRARSTWRGLGPRTVDERMRSALTLSVIGDCQAALQRHGEALAARQEAMALYQELPLRGRARWSPPGQLIAIGLVESLAAGGRQAEGVALATEVRSELRFLARVGLLRPELAQPRLGRLLTALARCLDALDDPDEARRAAEEAVAHWRVTLAGGASGDQGGLGDALLVLAEVAKRAGHPDEAAGLLAEAADLTRDVDDDVLGRVLPELAHARLAQGDRPGAEDLLAELIALCRRHHGELPELWRPRLALALSLLCILSAFDMPAPSAGESGPVGAGAGAPGPAETVTAAMADEGLAAGREAVELARQLADADPGYRNLLSGCLFGLARAEYRSGDEMGAMELLRECVDIRRELFADAPAHHRLRLVEALCDLGNRLHGLGRLDEALNAYRECVDLLRAAPERIDPEQLLAPLRNVMRTLWHLDRKAEAKHVWDEILAVEESAGSDPA